MQSTWSLNGISALSNILESIDIINEYLTEEDKVDIIHLDFSKVLISSFIRKNEKLYDLKKKKSKYCLIFRTDRITKVKIGNNYSEIENTHSCRYFPEISSGTFVVFDIHK